MRYASHHLSDLMRPTCIPNGLGVIFHEDATGFWARSTINQTIDNYYEVRVCANVLKLNCNVTYIGMIQFEDNIYEHINRDKLNKLKINYIDSE